MIILIFYIYQFSLKHSDAKKEDGKERVARFYQDRVPFVHIWVECEKNPEKHKWLKTDIPITDRQNYGAKYFKSHSLDFCPDCLFCLEFAEKEADDSDMKRLEYRNIRFLTDLKKKQKDFAK